MSFDFDFDLEPQRQRGRIGKDEYVLKEPTHGDVRAFQETALKAARMKDNKVVGYDGLSDADTTLLARCLWRVTGQHPDGSDTLKPVDAGTVRGWPNKVTKGLIDWAKRAGAIDDSKSADELRREIAELQERLDRKLADQPGNGRSGGGESSTPATGSGGSSTS